MNNMTGMELLAHLCARSPKTRVIFITGHEDPAAEATVRQAGAFAFFIKPFDNKRFLAAVRDAFDQTPPEKEGHVTQVGATIAPFGRRAMRPPMDG